MERKNIYRLGGATVLAVSAFFGYRAIRNSGLEPLTTDISVTNFITNGMTGAQYEVVPDPEGKNRECVRIGEYSQENHRTLVGASVVVGPEKDVYVDTNGVVFNNGVIIGYFNRSVLPSHEAIPLANQDSIVCPNN
ncbi:MAG: hypothetical protein Q8Q30_02580 [Candidatus Woesebacteria bacterium]|nr:hypothetical protein [Candidatus Woesebacteria bacterium]